MTRSLNHSCKDRAVHRVRLELHVTHNYADEHSKPDQCVDALKLAAFSLIHQLMRCNLKSAPKFGIKENKMALSIT